MKLSQWLLVFFVFLTGCTSFGSIPYSPTQTPQTWLKIQPFIQLQLLSKTILIIQPTTSALVYLLGLFAIAAGLSFWRNRKANASRTWWGIALVLWGAGAIFAGTSYEAFSYQLKCVGREACVWTSGLEIIYLVFSVGSIDAMLIAEAYACAVGKWRKALIGYSIINFALYGAAVLAGSLIPDKFLISFNLLILVCAPSILLLIGINGWRYHHYKQRMDLLLLGTCAWLILTIGAYFIYFVSGLTQTLWAHGIWFSDNDVLHIGLIIWMIYIAFGVARWVVDRPELSAEPAELLKIRSLFPE